MNSPIDLALKFFDWFIQPNTIILFLCVILPLLSIALAGADYLIKKLREALSIEFEEGEFTKDKLKNEDLALEEEKPKRGRMLIGDDGELLEIVEDENEQYQ